MFNIHETSSDRQREEVRQRRLEILRRAYQDGFFAEEGTVPMPEIVADGEPEYGSLSHVARLMHGQSPIADTMGRAAKRPKSRFRRPTRLIGDPLEKLLVLPCPDCGTAMDMAGDWPGAMDWCPQCKRYWGES